MSLQDLKNLLENKQVSIYFSTVIFSAVVAFSVPGTTILESYINVSLALMLLVTFIQVPLADLKHALRHTRFLLALLLVNFVLIPLLVMGLLNIFSLAPLIKLGVLFVLLTPCIDYVVTFSHLGRADARLLLAATPVLLLVQILMLPLYLGLFLGPEAAKLVKIGLFVDAFVWLIGLPLLLAGLLQFWAARKPTGERLLAGLSLMPVPATALVLFVVIAAVAPQVGPATGAALQVVPLYLVFAILSPLMGWAVGRLFKLEISAKRALAFSAGTRNSLVILPLALAVPGAVPVLPAIIVTQTLVELISELIYVRVISRLGNDLPERSSPQTV